MSTLAITAVLRQHLDRNLTGAAVGRVVIDMNRAEEPTALTVERYVQYGTDVLALGDRAGARGPGRGPRQ